MTYTEKILNKVAYGDGEKKVNENGLTVFDHGKPYTFNLGAAAYALDAPKDMNRVQGVAYRLVGLGARDEE